MLFDPRESIDFNGNTGPFIQYTHARICSVLRKAAEMRIAVEGVIPAGAVLADKEIALIKQLQEYRSTVQQAAENLSPAMIANYCFDLAKEFNQYYHDFSFLKEEDGAVRLNRLLLARETARVLRRGMSLLGIEVPERM